MQVGTDESHQVIVSMTSFPARIDSVWIAIASLLNQTYKPKKIILWLAEEQFTEHKLPKSLRRLSKRGLEIRYCEDVRPHKKYYYAMKEFPNDYIITADDDILYPENHVEKLYRASMDKPNTVICTWSHVIATDKAGGFVPYNDWKDDSLEDVSMMLLPVGCNGVLYPPHSLHEEAFNLEQIHKYIYTDDLWLKCMEVLQGTEAWNMDKVPLIYFNVIKSQKSGLWKSNATNEVRNDIVWKQLMEEYCNVRTVLMKS